MFCVDIHLLTIVLQALQMQRSWFDLGATVVIGSAWKSKDDNCNINVTFNTGIQSENS